MPIDKPDGDSDSEVKLLKSILSEIQDLNSQLARTDERSRNNRAQVEDLRDNRIVPMEAAVEKNDNRSRRNALIIGGFVTALTLFLGAGATYLFTLL
ncbi:hypothetical protein M192_gp122 [Halorubrum tailed phage 8]|uniref:Uncharacterized protein n=3 Tax=Haloferacalesvirus TaxID=2843389 RepID=R4TJE0_9CAUD|nr:hypothetical protein M192_gp122 [Halorubrum tailed phage 8]UBF19082.1 hypothetical protein HRTV-14_gp9 [Halorubrum phage HRTV-14]UBF19208.1 hypothetical protein HRTV-17_gp9 [Halorubrum phage HRTV-17]UBF19335.1 hypothetical protein HRTV-19_gp9 [Halorubrum virus HRTV-19]UBF19464.1 hypothetical protein HRTV-23_gp9 [Halorubrum virus HRTV-23]AGM10757.1 hypothetical protein HRTV8_10 [Halorubrum tailed phage 8]